MTLKNFNKKILIVPAVAAALLLVSFVFIDDNSAGTSEDIPNRSTQEKIATPKADGEVKGLEWHTDMKEVHRISQNTGKPIFAFFTGSDWCGWCKKLQREVFAKDAFVEWASENVVLLELDFPRRTVLDSTLQVQNYSLQRAFGVSGYPTIWIFKTELDNQTSNFSINAYGSLGYPRGATAGKEEELFIENANKILANKAG